MSNIERDYEHWVCPTCDSVDGPTDGYVCVICREESVNSEVEGLVRATTTEGAVKEAVERVLADDEAIRRAVQVQERNSGRGWRAAMAEAIRAAFGGQ